VSEPATRPGGLSRGLVAAQLLALALACVPFGPQRGGAAALVLIALGTALALATLGFNRIGNFSILPEPKAGARLVTAGPYRLVRHPMYLALVIACFGLAAYNGHWLNGLGLGALALVLNLKAAREERLLAERFPEYAAYARRTARFVPGLW